MDEWHPSDRAMFPDYFAKREKWYETRRKTWSEEMKWLQEWDKKNEEAVSRFTQFCLASDFMRFVTFYGIQNSTRNYHIY